MKKVTLLVACLIFAINLSGQEKVQDDKGESSSLNKNPNDQEVNIMYIQPPPDGGGDTYPWNRDKDGDGYGDPDDQIESETKPAGYVANNTDCDDTYQYTYPGAPEINDGRDNNCDGIIDNGTNPSMPGSISTTKYCDYTKLTRGTPPSGVTYYWQSSSMGTSTSNSNSSINRYGGSVYYLRARDNSTLFWSDARSVSYTIDQPSTWYADTDGDGYGNPSSTTSACSKPSGYVSNNSDCNDSDSGTYPGATEINDGKDNNCDGTIDNGTRPSMPGTINTTKYCDYTKLTRVTPPSGVTFYWQSSSSGTSTFNSSSSINRYSGSVYYLRARNNSTLFWSDARSVSYTIDQPSTWYVDADGDGYGNPSSTASGCSKPSGYVSNNSDCNDSDSGTYPGATEILDGKDNNCDGTIDNGTKPSMPGAISTTKYCDYTKLTRGTPPSGVTFYWQSSSSGISTSNSSSSINRYSGSVYYLRARNNSTLFWSDARSVSYTIDQPSTWYVDADGDGYGSSATTQSACSKPSGYVSNNSDCNDSDSDTYPGATEINDGKDNNCDGTIDNGAKPSMPGTISTTKYCDYTRLTRDTPPSGVTFYWQSSSSGTSTSNSSSSINRYSGSVYYLRARNNSTLFWSDARSVSYTIDQPSTWYVDADGDGYGSSATTQSACSKPSGYVSNNSDCNDSDSDTYPGATEINDGKDNNCDGTIDNGAKPSMPGTISTTKYCDYTRLTRDTPPSGVTFYWQSSSSGTSTSNSSSSIDRYSGSVYYLRARNNSTLFWSDASSVNYTIDQPSTWYADYDEDGLGDPSISTSACSQPKSFVSNNNDTDPYNVGNSSACNDPVSGLSDENYVYTRTYTKPVTSSGSNYSCDEVIGEVTYFDGLGRPVQQIGIRAGGSPHSNILSTNSWAPGNGSAPFFNQNGATSENSRIIGTDPFGRDELLWVCGNDATSNADGGWNTDYFPIDKNASYRYSVWVKRLGSQDGKTYHGTRNVNNLNGTENNNPYFWYGDMPNVGEWYLLVGIIHPYTYGGGNSGISGVYDKNGNKVKSGNDFKWRSTTIDTQLRSYLYYATITATRQYFSRPVFQKLDGSESSIEDLLGKAGKADVVTHINYDEYGRKTKDYLPVPMEDGNFGAYRGVDMETSVASYYLEEFSEDFPGMTTITANPFSEKRLEASPLNRVMEQGAPGKSWEVDLTSDSDHTIKFDYQVNDSGEVRLYEVDLSAGYSNPSLVNSGYYPAGELYKTITKDENWKSGTNHTTEEFKNKQGQVVLKRTYNDGAHDTYYIYDDYGNLTYVLPPGADATLGTPDATSLAQLCYQYKYDGRNRLIEKKIPGKGWEYIVYNKLDQPVMTQDPNLEGKDQWLFTKYDAFGRVVYTGIIDRAATRGTLQAEADVFSLQFEERSAGVSFEGRTIYYSNRAYPNSDISEIHTENYYDTYLASAAQAGINVPASNNLGEDISNKTKTLPTVNKVRVLDTNDWITTVSAYDDKGRVVWTKSVNPYLEITDLVESELDFTGKVLESKTIHSKTGKTDVTITDTYLYDHMGRLLEQKQKVNSNTTELIVRNTYDELGQLVQKQVGGLDKEIGLQKVDYTYNVRGWLKAINDPAGLGADLFAFGINYDDPEYGATPLFNGNISETRWESQSMNTSGNPVSDHYTYTYDALNRITDALDNTGNYNLSGITYDKMGNILSLQRQGHTDADATSFGTMDDLTYTYSGNQLMIVDDQAGTDQYGFKDDVAGSTLDNSDDYDYDTNGNLTSDANKGIAAGGIEYNHLNMPTKITVSNAGNNNGVLDYVYTADGIKLQKKKTQAGVTTTTDYARDFVYENKTLKQFYQPEGYVEPDGSGWQYVYQYRDIWGNTRVTYADDDNSGSLTSAEIRREQNYYPFGLEHKGYNNYSYGAKNNLKTYQGQEFTEDLGLNTHEWKYRMSDPAIGRFWQVDPLAEDYMYNSTYAFQENKMGMGVELEGLELYKLPNPIQSIGNSIASSINRKVSSFKRKVNNFGEKISSTLSSLDNFQQKDGYTFTGKAEGIGDKSGMFPEAKGAKSSGTYDVQVLVDIAESHGPDLPAPAEVADIFSSLIQLINEDSNTTKTGNAGSTNETSSKTKQAPFSYFLRSFQDGKLTNVENVKGNGKQSAQNTLRNDSNLDSVQIMPFYVLEQGSKSNYEREKDTTVIQ